MTVLPPRGPQLFGRGSWPEARPRSKTGVRGALRVNVLLVLILCEEQVQG